MSVLMIDAESQDEAATVCIRTCGNNMEANLLRSILSDAGVHCIVQGEQHRSMIGPFGSYIDLRILVRPGDAERATAILAASEQALKQSADLTEDGEQEGSGPAQNLVFRIQPNRRPPSPIPALAAGCGGVYLFATGAWVAGGGFLLLGAVLFMGARFGGRGRGGRCSTPSCQVFIPEEAQTCPGCGHTVAGAIEHADHRLRALEELRDRSRPATTSGDPR